MRVRRLATVASIAVAGCVVRPAPRVRSPAPAPVVARPEAPPPFRCGPRDREWERWSGDVFGRGLAVLESGPDPARLNRLTGDARAQAEMMLRRGIQACEIVAVQAIERAGWRSLVPDLTRAVAAESAELRVEVILALRALGSSGDFTSEFIAALGSRSVEARISAAIGARSFPLSRMRAPLLDRVRHDSSWLVRQHAADSLLELADVYPRGISQHPEIYAGLLDARLLDARAGSTVLADLLGQPAPPTPADLARFAAAADRLDAVITDRLAAGECSKSVPVVGVDLHIIRVNERVVALTVEDRIGSCERTLAFVAFLESPAGFGPWLSAGASGRDPLKTSIDALPAKLTVEYARATRALTVGALVLDATSTNVTVLSAGPTGVVARYRGTQNLTFPRRGRPAAGAVNLLRFQPEIAEEIRTLLTRSPQIGGLVAPVQRK